MKFYIFQVIIFEVEHIKCAPEESLNGNTLIIEVVGRQLNENVFFSV